MPLTIATWNVNSLRVRLPHVLTWLTNNKPDVLALQETKIIDDDFPVADITNLGYQVIYSGQKTYNGMALITKNACIDKLTDIATLMDPQRRILIATLGDIRIVNLYVPNGESVDSEKYLYKLNWLKQMRDFLAAELKRYPKMIVLGDFNIAPEEIDVHEPMLWEGKVLFSAKERSAFQELLNLGLHDCFRIKNPTEKSYSWWDYRMNAFKRNLGLRIDHVLVSKSILATCESCFIDKAERSLERPSDHVPVVARFLSP